GAEHHVHMLGRHRQFAIDGRSVRMDQFRPGGIPKPQGAATVPTEKPPRTAQLPISQPRLINAQMLFATDLQAGVVAAQVDRVAASTRRLAANRAVAVHEGIRLVRRQGKTHRTAMTGAQQFHHTLHKAKHLWSGAKTHAKGSVCWPAALPWPAAPPADSRGSSVHWRG